MHALHHAALPVETVRAPRGDTGSDAALRYDAWRRRSAGACVMTRPTLKLARKSATPAATAKPLSSRAKRAQLQGQRHRPPAMAAPAPAPHVPDASSEPARAPRVRAEARPRTDRGKRRGAAANVAPAAPGRGPATDPAGAPRHANPDDPRLSKRMSDLGLCSRREADEWIANGWVKVDGKVVAVLGTRVSPHARIEVAKAAAQQQGEQVTILLHKPVGYVSGQAEDGYKPASVLITPENRWAGDTSGTQFKPAHLRGLAPAGRLDIDSTGLIVFTQDGRVAKRLIGSHSEVEKEYLVRVEGELDAAGMELLQHGLSLDGVRLKPARVSWQNEDQLRFVLREGRKRQIRRMCELVGLAVTGLKRVRTGGVPLGPLPVGQWRYLRADEQF